MPSLIWTLVRRLACVGIMFWSIYRVSARDIPPGSGEFWLSMGVFVLGFFGLLWGAGGTSGGGDGDLGDWGDGD